MGSCKSFLIFLFICCYFQHGTPALTKAALENSKGLMKSMCKRSSKVSQDALEQFKNGNFLDDPKLKCYVHCCLQMMKTMKRDQITVADATKQINTLLPEEIREASLKQLNNCKDSDGANACDKAYNFVKCCLDTDSNNMLIPT